MMTRLIRHSALLLFLFAGTAFLARLTPADAQTPPTCQGLTATIYVYDGWVYGPEPGPYNGQLQGTSGNDVMVGTEDPDWILGNAGDDVICGRGGDDYLSGYNQNDTLCGEGGDDFLEGGNGSDNLDGGSYVSWESQTQAGDNGIDDCAYESQSMDCESFTFTCSAGGGGSSSSSSSAGGGGSSSSESSTATCIVGREASVVLGQDDFTSNAAPSPPAADTLFAPQGVDFFGDSVSFAQAFLGVADTSNNRVLIYDVSAITNGENAVSVVGQPSFTGNTAATTQAGMSAPRGLIGEYVPVSPGSQYYYNQLFVVDSWNNRVPLYYLSCSCGNATIEGGEACDGASLDSQTCSTQGFQSGTLACNSDCLSFNTSGCNNCSPPQAVEGNVSPVSDGCYDEADNDCDNSADCADSDCNLQDCGGNGLTCQSGSCVCANTPAETPESTLCGDSVDNDCDGQTDCADASCNNQVCAANGMKCQSGSCVCTNTPVQSPEATCNDSVDNDCDGQVDCADSNCNLQDCGGNGLQCQSGSCVCTHTPAESPESTCGDSVDNDCDGQVDCADSNCNLQDCGGNGLQCQSGSCVCTHAPPETPSELTCNDSVDNDCDGLTDCDDTDSCGSHPSCGTTINTPDSAGDVGYYSAIDCPTADNCKIVYTDETNNDLKFADCNDAACSNPAIRTLESAGAYSLPVAINCPTTANCKILYSDAGNLDLKFADCNNEACSNPVIRTIESTGPVGFYLSIDCPTSNNCKLAYEYRGPGYLKFADCNDESCSSPAIRILDTAYNVGTFNDIDCPTSDNCKISYLRSSNGDLKFADCNDEACSNPALRILSAGSNAQEISMDCPSASNCKVSYVQLTYPGAGFAYNLKFVDCNDEACSNPAMRTLVNGNADGFSSISCPTSDNCKISYVDHNNQYLRFADCNDESCTSPSYLPVDTTNSHTGTTSIDCPASDNCKISYYDSTNKDLQFADCGGEACPAP